MEVFLNYSLASRLLDQNFFVNGVGQVNITVPPRPNVIERKLMDLGGGTTMRAMVELPGLQGEVIREIKDRLLLGVEVSTEAEGRFLFDGQEESVRALFAEAMPHSIAPAGCSIIPVSCPGSIWG